MTSTGEAKREESRVMESSKKRIFIADDDTDILQIVQSLLECAGFSTETARDSEEALEQIMKLKYDLLVFGVLMPRVDGMRLLQAVRKSRTYAEVPVLFITSYSRKGRLKTRLRETACKAEGGIQEPLKSKLFLETVTALLERKKKVVEAQCN
jgi:DNA-binding response OmpR family regulator